MILTRKYCLFVFFGRESRRLNYLFVLLPFFSLLRFARFLLEVRDFVKDKIGVELNWERVERWGKGLGVLGIGLMSWILYAWFMNN